MEVLFQIFGPTLGWLVLAGGALAGLVCGCILAWTLRRRDWPSARRAGLLLSGLAVIVPPLSFFAIVHSDPFNARSFERRGWAADSFRAECGRGQMAGDLLRYHLKLGATKERVLLLLGPPDTRQGSSGGLETYRYSLGHCSGFRIEGDYLDVMLDASGHVVSAHVWQS